MSLACRTRRQRVTGVNYPFSEDRKTLRPRMLLNDAKTNGGAREQQTGRVHKSYLFHARTTSELEVDDLVSAMV